MPMTQLEIQHLNSEALLKRFEDMVRDGGGPMFVEVVWMRNEILRRMLSIDKP